MQYGDRLVNWKLIYTSQAKKDAKKISRSGLKYQAEQLLEILENNQYQTPPSYEKLVGDLAGACSRRINIQITGSAYAYVECSIPQFSIFTMCNISIAFSDTTRE